MDQKAPIAFYISGGNNQILPNATEAVQNFYGDNFQPHLLAPDGQQLSQEAARLKPYIGQTDVLVEYVGRLALCADANELGRVVVDMMRDERVKVDAETIVKEKFIRIVMPLAPRITCGVSNVRKSINNMYDKYRKIG